MASTQDQLRCIVTGGSGGIGASIVKGLAQQGYDVTIVCRNEKRGLEAARSVVQVTGNTSVHVETVDLGRWTEVKAFANTYERPLHVLVNNAAEAPRSRTTNDGLERQFGTNVMGYFYMMKAFEPHLRAATTSTPSGVAARVVNVASYWAGGLNINDLQFARRSYDNDDAYRQSKQADRMLTAAFAKKWRCLSFAVMRERDVRAEITVNAAHPGDVNTILSNNLGFGGHESGDQGAATPLYLATDAALEGVTGQYYEHKRLKTCSFCRDQKAVDALYAICEKIWLDKMAKDDGV